MFRVNEMRPFSSNFEESNNINQPVWLSEYYHNINSVENWIVLIWKQLYSSNELLSSEKDGRKNLKACLNNLQNILIFSWKFMFVYHV